MVILVTLSSCKKPVWLKISEITGNVEICESCKLRKHHQESFPQKLAKKATEKLELIHINICGPISTMH